MKRVISVFSWLKRRIGIEHLFLVLALTFVWVASGCTCLRTTPGFQSAASLEEEPVL